MNYWNHTMSCDYPEGCTCNASEHNEAVRRAVTAERALKDARELEKHDRQEGLGEG